MTLSLYVNTQNSTIINECFQLVYTIQKKNICCGDQYLTRFYYQDKKLNSHSGPLTLYQTKKISALLKLQALPDVNFNIAEPHSVQDIGTGGRWFDPQLGQYSVTGLMIVIVIEFGSSLSTQSIVSTMVIWESSQQLGKNIVLVLVKRTPEVKHG